MSAAVVLVGMPGAGKTTVGALVAAALDAPFVDLDARVESSTGLAPAAWIRKRGEAAFRAVEAQALREILARAVDAGPRVVATGGGVVERADNRKGLAATPGVVCVWLDAPLEVLAARAGHGDRPLLDDSDALARLWRRRVRLYAEVAHVRVDATPPPAEVARAIVEAVGERVAAGRSEGAPGGSGCDG